jgi:hypothetical protein
MARERSPTMDRSVTSFFDSLVVFNRAKEERVCSSFFFENRSVTPVYGIQTICFSARVGAMRKVLLDLDRPCGEKIAPHSTMQLKIRTKVTYGFLVLAFGIMLTDVCRLMLAPSAVAMSAASNAQHMRKF